MHAAMRYIQVTLSVYQLSHQQGSPHLVARTGSVS